MGRWCRLALATLGLSTTLALAVCATPGKDGVGSSLSGVINTYYAGSGTASGTSVTLGTINPNGAQTALSAGDLILIVQMQDGLGADFTTNTQGGTYGVLAAGNKAGQYEYATVQSVSSGVVTLSASLLNSYVEDTANGRTFQVVRVPQYSSATVSGVLKAAPWTTAGSAPSGGIVAMDVAGQTTLNANIDVSGQGFRGGAGLNGAGNRAGGLYSDQRYLYQSPVNGASKGEGTAGTPRFVFDGTASPFDNGTVGYPNGGFGQGAPGSAGGGGNDGTPATGNNQYNSGGGGGANAGAGGQGGYNWAGTTTLGSVGSDAGGRGGRVNSSSTTRLFMGGGGGAGSSNNNGGTNAVSNGLPSDGPITSSGASGGGMVFLRTGSLTGGGQINANGTNGVPVSGASSSEASGGGGAGGSVFLRVNSGSPSVIINAQGGKGGNSNYVNHGPGGGGGGGYIAASSTVVGTRNVNGGAHGLDSSSQTYGSVDGSAGAATTFTAQPGNGTSSSAACLPVLTVTKSTSTPARTLGSDTTASYTITVSNDSSAGGALGVSIVDPLPTPFSYSAASVSASYTGSASGPSSIPVSGTTTVNFGTAGGDASNSFTIPQGGSVSLTFTVNLNSAPAATYQNPASVTFSDPTRTTTTGTVSPGGAYAGGGTAGGSNYASGSSTAEDVTVKAAAPTINLTKFVRNIGTSLASNSGTFSSSSATGKPGEYLEYCIAYQNSGTGSATSLLIKDTIAATSPAQLSGYGAGTGIYFSDGGSLANGATARPTNGTTNSALTSNDTANSRTLTASDLTFKVPTVAVNGKGVVCFKTAVP